MPPAVAVTRKPRDSGTAGCSALKALEGADEREMEEMINGAGKRGTSRYNGEENARIERGTTARRRRSAEHA
jgi:hypothetical protein